MVATFLALRVLINFFRLGLLRYWQRQGFCSLILLQHNLDGGDEDVIAVTHALSCVGLHVTAPTDETCASARSSTTRAHNAMYDAFIFVFVFQFLCVYRRSTWFSGKKIYVRDQIIV